MQCFIDVIGIYVNTCMKWNVCYGKKMHTCVKMVVCKAWQS